MSKLRAVLPSTTKRRHDFISCLSSQTNLSSHDFPFDVDVTVRHLEAERNVGQICQFVRLLVDEVPSRAYNAAQRCSKTRPFKPFRLSILSNSHFDFEILDRCQIQMRLVSRQGETGFWPTLAALPDSFACLTAWTTQPHNPSQNGSGLHLLNQFNPILFVPASGHCIFFRTGKRVVLVKRVCQLIQPLAAPRHIEAPRDQETETEFEMFEFRASHLLSSTMFNGLKACEHII